jgi:hypothetical protein
MDRLRERADARLPPEHSSEAWKIFLMCALPSTRASRRLRRARSRPDLLGRGAIPEFDGALDDLLIETDDADESVRSKKSFIDSRTSSALGGRHRSRSST